MEHPSPSPTNNSVSIMLHVNIEDLNASAKALLQTAVENYHPTFGTGSMSCSIYDTAWVSRLTKPGINGQPAQWLFPECFFYVLETQSDDGSWGLPGGSQIDGILCTAASLLSILRHQSAPLQLQDTMPVDLSNRAAKALKSLRSQLQSWDVVSTVHVGFEIIVPALLRLLAEEDSSMDLNFDGFKDLMKINAKKMSRFRAECLYAHDAPQSTVLHSPEAFVGMDSEDKVDFDRIVHHKRLGSMMGSPASTAAYLMNVSRWDDKAETYLRFVVGSGPGRGYGGVPSAYPSTYFEFSWVLSTLLTSEFSPAGLESTALSKMLQVLSEGLENERGTIGFAPNFLADIDDTAKAITCLRILGRNVDPGNMIEQFEGETHFTTFSCERNPSFSANCNALLALLHQENPKRFTAQITKAVRFLCEYWWNAVDRIQDKWNLSHLYPTLLLVDALVILVELIESGDLPAFQDEILQAKATICLYQACYRALLDQEKDTGSWNGSLEETAYGTMILCQATKSDLFRDFDEQFQTAIHQAVGFLQLSSNQAKSKPERHLWVEKVGYSSPVLAETYRLAALRRAAASPVLQSQVAHVRVGYTLRQDTTAIPQVSGLLHRTPLFGSTPEWEIRASTVEGMLFRPIIRALRLSVFTRKGVEEDKYFDVIPLAWPACNNRTRIFAPSCFLFEGMMAAMVTAELRIYLQTHVTQSEDNSLLQQGTFRHDSMTMMRDDHSFFRWVRTTSADHTSATYTFYFWACLLSSWADGSENLLEKNHKAQKDCFGSTMEKYYAAAMCQHMATLCRMYNDLGSISRDRDEGNLNSVDFPEFETTEDDNS